MSMKHAVPVESSSRRKFTIQAVMALLSGYVIIVSDACSSSNTAPTPPAPTPTPADITGVVSANHGHVATVTGVQINAANQVTLDITGTATHSHSLTLTAANLTSLKSRQAVTVTSTNNSNHMHDVTFTPA
jgi:hypothetical protein